MMFVNTEHIQAHKVGNAAFKLCSTLILLSILALSLSACGAGSDTNSVHTDSPANDAVSNNGTVSRTPRTGTLTLTISIQQELEKKSANDLSVHHYASNYDYILRLKQKVYIEEDFRYFETPAGPDNSEERLDYFGTRPFWSIKGIEPDITGDLKYDSLQKVTRRPRAQGPRVTETKIEGMGKPLRLKIEPVEPSRYGNGLELKLNWEFLGTQTTSKSVTGIDDNITNDVYANDKKRIKVEEWLFSPFPNDVRIHSYPFAYEYEGKPRLIKAAQDNVEKTAKFYQKLHDKEIDHFYFLGAVTHLDKNEMTIRYKGRPSFIDQNQAFVFPAIPNLTNDFDVTLHVVAD